MKYKNEPTFKLHKIYIYNSNIPPTMLRSYAIEVYKNERVRKRAKERNGVQVNKEEAIKHVKS